MRTYTLLVSIAAHILLAIAVVGVTLTATDVLPDPRRASETVVVTAVMPRTPSEPVRRSSAKPPVASAGSENVAPLTAPEAVRPETGLDVPPDPGAAIGSLPIGIPGGGGAAIDAPPPPPPAVALPPLRVGSGIRPPQKVHDVAPIYPALAQSARVSGTVILEAVIKEDGSVADVRVLRSIPLLDQAATDAVRQWRFTPTLLNGQPVSVIMTVTVAFSI